MKSYPGIAIINKMFDKNILSKYNSNKVNKILCKLGCGLFCFI
jgi:hypothetical protein